MQVVIGFKEHHPRIHESAWIAPSASVIGQVTLGREVSVWFSAVLRGDNDLIEVGASTNIQDGAVVHVDSGYPCSIGERCVIGHRAVLHGCSIGNEVLIGIGAIVLNGAIVPDGCLVGAGALVPENKCLEAGFLYMGVPARKVRELSGEERDRIRTNAEGYVTKARIYANESNGGEALARVNFEALAAAAYPNGKLGPIEDSDALWSALFELPEWLFALHPDDPAKPYISLHNGKTCFFVFTDSAKLAHFLQETNLPLAQGGAQFLSMPVSRARRYIAQAGGKGLIDGLLFDFDKPGWYAPYSSLEKIYRHIFNEGK